MTKRIFEINSSVQRNKICSLVVFTGFSFLSAAENPAKPNIIIILADDMGYGDVSFYNPDSRVETPNIDRLAANSIVFKNAHAAGSLSVPSRYGLLTGQYFFRADKSKSKSPLGFLEPLIEPEYETIAKALKNNDYTTACIGKWHLGLEWELLDENQSVVIENNPRKNTNIDYKKPVKNGPNNHGFDYSFILPASLDMPPYVFVKNGLTIDSDIILATDKYPKSLSQTKPFYDKMHINEDNDNDYPYLYLNSFL